MNIRLITLAVAAAALATTASAAEVKLAAHLMGANEKPAAGDPDGMGHANIRIDEAKGELCYDLMVEKLGAATAAHIHKAGADAAGPVAVPLAKPDAAGKASGCAKADAAVLKDIAANPGGYYVNVHTADFGAGAIRGQLSK